MWSQVPSVPDPPIAQMPGTQEASGPQTMLGLGSSSSQAASGIQFPSSPTLESVPDRFLSSFAIMTQVCILKKAAGHGAVCKRQHTPFLPWTTLSHYLLEQPGARPATKPGTCCLPSVGMERLVFPKGGQSLPPFTHS